MTASRVNGIHLCLVRCGETSWDAQSRLVGAADLPLSDAGRSAVVAAVGRVHGAPLGVVYHPPDEASSETAALVAAPSHAKMKAVAELADPHLGLLEGLTRQVFGERFPKRFKRWQDDPLSVSPPQGEDLVEARARVFAAVARLLRRSKGESAIVLHPIALGFLHCWLAQRSGREIWAVLEERPRVERYVLTLEMLEWLHTASEAVPSQA